ncbi:MAG: response regulator [Terriglobales bacterium]
MTLQQEAYANDVAQRGTILLVEDEPFVREATRTILQHAGFDVFTAENALDAIGVFDECKRGIDLLITDMVLPGRTGQQLGDDLRRRSPELMVMITSGYGSPEDETEANKSHTYFLGKPYSRRMLIEKVQMILGTVRLARQVSQAG